MATLFIQTEDSPFTVNLPLSISMNLEQFYEFCRANPELQIERTALGDLSIRSPAFSDTGNRNLKISQQLVNLG